MTRPMRGLVARIAATLVALCALALAAAAPPSTKAPSQTATSTNPASVPVPAHYDIVMAPAPPLSANQSKPDWTVPVITGLFSFGSSVLVLIAALWNTGRTVKSAQRTAAELVHQKANEAELESIQARLNDFYGPYLQRSEENRLVAAELRSRQPDPTNFRLLLALQDPAWRAGLSPTDKTLVNEVVSNGEALRDLLRSKAGLAETGLQDLFAQAATHFTFLSLSSQGHLAEPSRFLAYVYPRKLDVELRAAIARLEARAAILRAEPAQSHGLAIGLQSPTIFAAPP